jgi:hypothetical protein
MVRVCCFDGLHGLVDGPLIQRLWLVALISNIGRWGRKKSSRRHIGFPGGRC